MKALLLTDYRKLEITDMPSPKIGEHDVMVRVASCGICGSDIHGYDGGSGRRVPPLVMGHEAAGVIEAVGKHVSRFKPGEQVTFDSMISCGQCMYCRGGRMNLCTSRRVLGVSCEDYRQHGCFAEYVAVPQHIVHRVPEGLPLTHAAMTEPVSIAVHAVERTPIALGASALVVGCGMIGLLCIQTLRAAGCGRIIASDVDDTRLERAGKLGADATLNARQVDVIEAVREQTDGEGVDLAMEAVGATDPIRTAIKATRKGGSVTLVGNVTPTIDLPLQDVVTRELNLIGTCGSNGEYPACLDMMARGSIDVASLITATAPLEDGPLWFDRLYNHEPGLMKIVLQPG